MTHRKYMHCGLITTDSRNHITDTPVQKCTV